MLNNNTFSKVFRLTENVFYETILKLHYTLIFNNLRILDNADTCTREKIQKLINSRGTRIKVYCIRLVFLNCVVMI